MWMLLSEKPMRVRSRLTICAWAGLIVPEERYQTLMSLLAMFPASLRAFAMLGAFRGYGCVLLQPGRPG